MIDLIIVISCIGVGLALLETGIRRSNMVESFMGGLVLIAVLFFVIVVYGN